MIVGCYELHLYCDQDPCKEERMFAKSNDPALQRSGNEFTGSCKAAAMQSALMRGWRVTRGKVSCPSCSGVRK